MFQTQNKKEGESYTTTSGTIVYHSKSTKNGRYGHSNCLCVCVCVWFAYLLVLQKQCEQNRREVLHFKIKEKKFSVRQTVTDSVAERKQQCGAEGDIVSGERKTTADRDRKKEGRQKIL